MPLLEQDLSTLQEHMIATTFLCVVCVSHSFVFRVVFCMSLLVFFIWPLNCLPFINLRLLITPLIYLIFIRIIYRISCHRRPFQFLMKSCCRLSFTHRKRDIPHTRSSHRRVAIGTSRVFDSSRTTNGRHTATSYFYLLTFHLELILSTL